MQKNGSVFIYINAQCCNMVTRSTLLALNDLRHRHTWQGTSHYLAILVSCEAILHLRRFCAHPLRRTFVKEVCRLAKEEGADFGCAKKAVDAVKNLPCVIVALNDCHDQNNSLSDICD